MEKGENRRVSTKAGENAVLKTKNYVENSVDIVENPDFWCAGCKIAARFALVCDFCTPDRKIQSRIRERSSQVKNLAAR